MKSERLLAITMLLLEQEQISAPKLAETFEVSVRTIYRDIDSLSQAGIPVTALPGSKGGIRIMDNYKIDQRFFTNADLVALLIGLSSFTQQLSPKSAPYTLEKLKSLMPKSAAKEITIKADQLVIDLSPWISGELATHTIELFHEAMDQSLLLSFNYENRKGQSTTRVVEPYRLILKESSWYTQAFCLQKESFRLFKLSRMKDVQLTHTPFEKRTAPPVSLGDQVISPKPFVPLSLEVDYSIKDTLAERFNDLEFVPIDASDRYLVDFPYFMADDYGYRMLLGFGTRCKCLAPEYVRKELLKRSQQISAMYE